MTFDSIWNFFTYIFRIFNKDRRPEYIKAQDDELECIEINETQREPYTFVIIRN